MFQLNNQEEGEKNKMTEFKAFPSIEQSISRKWFFNKLNEGKQ